jgi:hypothetical protein
MICGYIYKIEFPNGKHYIGQTTTSLEQRQEEHKKCAKNDNKNWLLYNALRKYEMVDTFAVIEIDKADTFKELCEKEIEYILTYNSYYMNKKGYNMTLGGEGTNGYVYTEEVKQKMSQSQKKFNEENPGAVKERFKNPEVRRKISKAQEKRFKNPEEIEKISKAQEKRFEKLEARQKLSQIHKKRLENPKARQQISEALKRYNENQEARQQKSKIMENYYQNTPDAIQKNRAAQLKYQQEHPEARQKMSELKKEFYKQNPQAKIEYGKKMKEYHNNPEAKKKILDIRGKNKPFDIFTVDGTFVKTFTYQFEAKEYLQKEYNITSTLKIGEVLAGNRISSAGFIFKYK